MGEGTVPDRNTIKNWVQNFRTMASATNKKPGAAVRTVRTPEGTAGLRATIGRNPKRSARRHSVALTISSRSLQQTLHSDLYFHTYKLNFVQELASRSAFCEQFVTLAKQHADVIYHLIISDEGHSKLSGCVNNQTCSIRVK